MDESMNSQMPGMDMSAAGAPSTAANASMTGGTDCKIMMLWNWYTVDACFLSKTWQIRSAGGFAALCLGVVLLVLLLELLRRAAKFYDASLVRRRQLALSAAGSLPSTASSAHTLLAEKARARVSPRAASAAFRPSFTEQGVRALLHTMQFAVAYWIMLLAMYYNGYILICIFIGAFLGAYVFRWETLGGPPADDPSDPATETTGCCG